MGLVEVINLVIKQGKWWRVNVHAFDSKLAAMIEEVMYYVLLKWLKKDTNQQIIDDLTNMREHTGAYLIVDDLKNLQKSGRITGAQAWVEHLLKMKPVLKFEDGKIIPEEKVRTKKRAIQTLEKKVLDIVKDFEEVTLLFINGDHFSKMVKRYTKSYKMIVLQLIK